MNPYYRRGQFSETVLLQYPSSRRIMDEEGTDVGWKMMPCFSAFLYQYTMCLDEVFELDLTRDEEFGMTLGNGQGFQPYIRQLQFELATFLAFPESFSPRVDVHELVASFDIRRDKQLEDELVRDLLAYLNQTLQLPIEPEKYEMDLPGADQTPLDQKLQFVVNAGWQDEETSPPQVDRVSDWVERTATLEAYLEHWHSREFWESVLDGLLFLAEMSESSPDESDPFGWIDTLDDDSTQRLPIKFMNRWYGKVCRSSMKREFFNAPLDSLDLRTDMSRLLGTMFSGNHPNSDDVVYYRLWLNQESWNNSSTERRVRLILHECRHLYQTAVRLPCMRFESISENLWPQELDAQYFQEVVFTLFNYRVGRPAPLPFHWKAYVRLNELLDHSEYGGPLQGAFASGGLGETEADDLEDLANLAGWLEATGSDEVAGAFADICLRHIGFFSAVRGSRLTAATEPRKPHVQVDWVRRMQGCVLPDASPFPQARWYEELVYHFINLAHCSDGASREAFAKLAMYASARLLHILPSSRTWKYISECVAILDPKTRVHAVLFGKWYSMPNVKVYLQPLWKHYVHKSDVRKVDGEPVVNIDGLKVLASIPSWEEDLSYIGCKFGEPLVEKQNGEAGSSSSLIDGLCGVLQYLQAGSSLGKRASIELERAINAEQLLVKDISDKAVVMAYMLYLGTVFAIESEYDPTKRFVDLSVEKVCEGLKYVNDEMASAIATTAKVPNSNGA